MTQITEKALSALSALMHAESVMVAKCYQLAEMTEDAALKDRYLNMAGRHQSHLDQLYSNLK